MKFQLSLWIESGIQINKVRNLYLFKFNLELQYKLDQLTEKKKVDVLTSAENDELTIILELNQILTLLNAKIIAFNDDY